MEDRLQDAPRPTLLERLDVALAGRIAARSAEPDGIDPLQTPYQATAEDRLDWIQGLLALRGFRLPRDEVAAVLTGSRGRYRPEHQESKLIIGLHAAIADMLGRAASGLPPDGWSLVESFRRTTAAIERFRSNVLRRDEPWDALPRVRYPAPATISDALDRFHTDSAFGDDPERFDRLHPVRQGLRAMWRFARIAPFPDFNLVFAALAFGGHLAAHGYPPLLPAVGDRIRLERLIRGPVPIRSLALERRLLDQVVGLRATKG